MSRNTFRFLAAAIVPACAAGCGAATAGVASSESKEASTRSALQSGATEERAYLGTDNHITLGGAPILATMGLLGGSQIELEVVTPDGAPVRFEVWRVRNDGTATLEMPVDATSGFALQEIDPVEDGTWAIRWPAGQRGDVTVHASCVGGLRGCAQARQPGEACPAGWTCDVGLACELPVGVCGSLAGVGTCVAKPTDCTADAGAVCGCDGRTYASDCDARLGGVPILDRASCEEPR